MGLLALLIAQTIDPIRVGLVLLCVWFVVKTYASHGIGRKLLAYAIMFFFIALAMLLMIEAMHITRSSDDVLVLRFIVGYASNWLIAGIAHGIIRLFNGPRRQPR